MRPEFSERSFLVSYLSFLLIEVPPLWTIGYEIGPLVPIIVVTL